MLQSLTAGFDLGNAECACRMVPLKLWILFNSDRYPEAPQALTAKA